MERLKTSTNPTTTTNPQPQQLTTIPSSISYRGAATDTMGRRTNTGLIAYKRMMNHHMTLQNVNTQVIRKTMDLTGKQPGRKVTLSLKTIRSISPNELTLTLFDPRNMLLRGVLISTEGQNIGIQFVPKLNGLYRAEVMINGSNKSILSKPLEIIVTGLEEDFTSSDIMAEIKRRKEKQVRRRTLLKSSTQGGVDSSPLDKTSEEKSIPKTPRKGRNLWRFRLPTNVVCTEGALIDFLSPDNVSVCKGNISKISSVQCIDLLSPPIGEFTINLPNLIEQTKSYNISITSIRENCIGTEVVFPLKPLYKPFKIPTNADLANFKITVKNPTGQHLDGKIIFDKQYCASFTPWVKGLYLIRVLYESKQYIHTAMLIECNPIMKQIVDTSLHISPDNIFHYIIPNILDINGRSVTHRSQDFLFLYRDINSKPNVKKKQGTIIMNEDESSIKVTIKVKRPGTYSGQLYLWEIPVLTGDVKFEWKSDGNIRGRTQLLIKDINLLGSEISRSYSNLKTLRLSKKSAQFTETDILCDTICTKIRKLLGHKNLDWALNILEKTSDLRTLFTAILKQQNSLICLFANNLGLIENPKTLDYIITQLSLFVNICGEFIKLITLTLQSDKESRKTLSQDYINLYSKLEEILLPLSEEINQYIQKTPQTIIIIPQLDLYHSTEDPMEEITHFLNQQLKIKPKLQTVQKYKSINQLDNNTETNDDKSNYRIISNQLICSPHEVPTAISQTIHLLTLLYQELLQIFSNPNGSMDRIKMVSNLCKLVLLIQQIFIPLQCPKFRNEENAFLEAWDIFKNGLFKVVGSYLRQSDGTDLDIDLSELDISINRVKEVMEQENTNNLQVTE